MFVVLDTLSSLAFFSKMNHVSLKELKEAVTVNNGSNDRYKSFRTELVYEVQAAFNDPAVVPHNGRQYIVDVSGTYSTLSLATSIYLPCLSPPVDAEVVSPPSCKVARGTSIIPHMPRPLSLALVADLKSHQSNNSGSPSILHEFCFFKCFEVLSNIVSDAMIGVLLGPDQCPWSLLTIIPVPHVDTAVGRSF